MRPKPETTFEIAGETWEVFVDPGIVRFTQQVGSWTRTVKIFVDTENPRIFVYATSDFSTGFQTEPTSVFLNDINLLAAEALRLTRKEDSSKNESEDKKSV